jgi:DNA-binding HxlR family transcriptional regulator
MPNFAQKQGMYEKKMRNEFIECGMGITMEMIGGKWKPCLILSIHQGLKRPTALHKAHPNASSRVLNQQLAELEDYGIIAKKVYPVLPPRVEYSLTAFGETILPIIYAMEKWGLEYQDTFREKHQQRMERAAIKKLHYR